MELDVAALEQELQMLQKQHHLVSLRHYRHWTETGAALTA